MLNEFLNRDGQAHITQLNNNAKEYLNLGVQHEMTHVPRTQIGAICGIIIIESRQIDFVTPMKSMKSHQMYSLSLLAATEKFSV